jgi:peptidyl-prolyl cis-trans isomerase B (cyclophilin B)
MRRASIILVLAVGLAGCGGSSSSGTTTSTAAGTTSTPPATNAEGCRTVPVPRARANGHLKAPTLRLNPHKTYTVTVTTNCGTFAFTLDVKQSPKTSASFYSLVKRGFFDGLIFHRVAAGFVIQGGDPTQTGAGGPGYTVVEAPPKNVSYAQGDVAMAKTQTQPSGASGSQFFIVTAPSATAATALTPVYALLGKVVSGLNMVEAIGRLPTNPAGDGMPTPAVVMSSVTVSES